MSGEDAAASSQESISRGSISSDATQASSCSGGERGRAAYAAYVDDYLYILI